MLFKYDSVITPVRQKPGLGNYNSCGGLKGILFPVCNSR